MNKKAKLLGLFLVLIILSCMNGCQRDLNLDGTTKNIALIVRMNNGYTGVP